MQMQTKRHSGNFDIPETRPRTIADARGLITRIFAENNWDADAQRRYLKIHGYDMDLGSLMPEGVRSIVRAMESSRMVNFKD